MSSLPSLIVVLCGLLVNSVFCEFSYEGDTGPPFWPCLFPEECGGHHQSPVALNNVASESMKAEAFVFKDFENVPISASLSNTGHSAQVSFTLSDKAVVSGGGLPGSFVFSQFHFHWGSNSKRGSEHIMDGVQYPMEMHIVNQNANYDTFSEAILHDDGLAVLGVFHQVDAKDNLFLTLIVENLALVPNEGDIVTFDYPFSLLDLIPRNHNSFYRYFGSLTTPNCNEAVTWTVFTGAMPISEGQLNAFRSLFNAENMPIVDNFRPVQPINDRTLYMTD